MTSVEQREQWRERVKAFRASGQSMAAWCVAQGIKPHQLRCWLPRLAQAPEADGTPQWLPVTVHEQEASVSGNGMYARIGPDVVEVQPGFDLALLTAVVRALRWLC